MRPGRRVRRLAYLVEIKLDPGGTWRCWTASSRRRFTPAAAKILRVSQKFPPGSPDPAAIRVAQLDAKAQADLLSAGWTSRPRATVDVGERGRHAAPVFCPTSGFCPDQQRPT